MWERRGGEIPEAWYRLPIFYFSNVSEIRGPGEPVWAPDGSIEWLCLPRPDGPSVFGALLDRSAGFFRFGPSGIEVPNQRRYIPGTNVLETTWHTPTGWLVVSDLLVVGPAPTDERRERYRRAVENPCGAPSGRQCAPQTE